MYNYKYNKNLAIANRSRVSINSNLNPVILKPRLRVTEPLDRSYTTYY